jgi:carbonic anhydrase
MKRVSILAAASIFVFASGLLYAETGAVPPLEKLMAGNARFCAGAPSKMDASKERRMEISKGQHPVAIVLSCSDSRVPPEIVFDQGLGEVFVVRVAGNVVDDVGLGSIEYGVEHLHTPLLVVLGHSKCGAVTAALDAQGEPEGNIGAILKKIKPAVEKAKASGKKEKAEVLDLAIRENVRNVRADLLKRSKIVEEMNHSGKLKIVLAEYDLESGKVVSIGE